MEIPKTVAFTTVNENLAKRLLNEAFIEYNNTIAKAVALWDTGASCSCVSKDVISALNLLPIGMTTITTPSGKKDVCTYMVDIILPNKLKIQNVVVCESEIGVQGIGVLIGMDIIGLGDFSVSNYNDKTVFTYRVPSCECTDYVSQIKKQDLVSLTGNHGQGKRKHKKK